MASSEIAVLFTNLRIAETVKLLLGSHPKTPVQECDSSLFPPQMSPDNPVVDLEI